MYIEAQLEDKVTRLLEQMPKNMGHTLGIEFLSFAKDEVKARMPVDERTIQPFGILHGGASVALAESVMSIGAWVNIDEAKIAVGVEINANHLRSVSAGTSVVGTARPIRKGRKIHVWEAEIHDADETLICVSRCTLAIVENRNKPDALR